MPKFSIVSCPHLWINNIPKLFVITENILAGPGVYWQYFHFWFHNCEMVSITEIEQGMLIFKRSDLENSDKFNVIIIFMYAA